jgi:hypothetical protein
MIENFRRLLTSQPNSIGTRDLTRLVFVTTIQQINHSTIMPSYYDSISEDLAEWALKQSLFFVGSAGTHGKHVNISPKGYPGDTFAILHPTVVAYLDYTGSGVETISHIYDNGNVTVMFCRYGTWRRVKKIHD